MLSSFKLRGVFITFVNCLQKPIAIILQQKQLYVELCHLTEISLLISETSSNKRFFTTSKAQSEY